MKFTNDEAEIIAAVRARSSRFIRSVFGGFALMFCALALGAHHAPHIFDIPAGEMPRIAMAFLFLASAYTLTIFVWEWLYQARVTH